MNQGFFAQVTQATISLVTLHSAIFASYGLNMFRGIAVCMVMWEAFRVAVRHEPASRLVTVLWTAALTYALLTYYTRPFPGTAQNLTQIVTDAGSSLANDIDNATQGQVGVAMTQALGQATASTWSMVMEPLATMRYLLLVVALTGAQVAMLGVIAFGFVAVGVIVLIGPIFIPLLMVPYFEWVPVSWFRSLVQFSFYPVIGNAFVYVYGQIWLNYLAQATPLNDSQTIAALIMQIMILTMAGVFGILKVPQLVSAIFSGGSGLSAVSWR